MSVGDLTYKHVCVLIHTHTHANTHSCTLTNETPQQEVISVTQQDLIMISNAVELHWANKGILPFCLSTMFNLSTPGSRFLTPLYFSFLFCLSATSLECADGEFRDVSSAPVPRRSGQLLPPGQNKKIDTLTHSI